jgi:rubrerythrin
MRLIDANKLVEKFDSPALLNQQIIKIINAEETVDAAPVVHGKWKLLENNSQSNFYMCSNCSYMVFSEWFLTDYCPSCGAKMDGGLADDD